MSDPLNHAFVDPPYSPFETIDEITSLRAAHHAGRSTP